MDTQHVSILILLYYNTSLTSSDIQRHVLIAQFKEKIDVKQLTWHF